MRRYTIALMALLVLAPFSQVFCQEAQPCAGMSPFCSCYGRTVLTYGEAQNLRDRGYQWNSIYAASLIAAQTGESVKDLLRHVYVVGRTWQQLAIERGLDWRQIRENAYDFGPTCIAAQIIE